MMAQVALLDSSFRVPTLPAKEGSLGDCPPGVCATALFSNTYAHHQTGQQSGASFVPVSRRKQQVGCRGMAEAQDAET